MSKTIPHVPLLVESTLYVRPLRSGSKVSSLSKIARSVLPVQHKELFRDVRNVITGFLKNNCMKLTTGSRDNVSRISARRVWIPLEERKTILMMHEITFGCINVTNRAHQVWIDQNLIKGRTRARGIGKGPVPARGFASTGLWVPARAVLALPLPVVAERTRCIPIWMVRTGGCGGVTEIAEHRRGRSGAALTGIPCEAHKWASSSRPGGGACCSRPGGGLPQDTWGRGVDVTVSVKTGTAETASRGNVRRLRR